MAKKNKKNKKEQAVQQPVAPQPVVTEVIQGNVPVTEEAKKYVVNCHRCGAALNVQQIGVAYMCPVCNNLFRVRIGEKLVKDVSRVTVAEAYVNVHKGIND
ncbi:MAG: hypothetical protein E7377_03860 [Clostridiales bacterium]|nr:hypothetical protein [Clostridiales bacterium]